MRHWPEHDVQVNGIQVHYVRTGGNKPAFVLAHGFTDYGLCWAAVAQALERDYDLIMPDARGHGRSSAPEDGYGYTTLAEDLCAFCDALGLEKPLLMGHSMGAATVAQLAAARPDLPRAIILEDPPWRESMPVGGEARREQADGLSQQIIAQNAMSAEELISPQREQYPTWSDLEMVHWAESKRLVSPNAARIITAKTAPWQETASAITCPLLLLRADPDLGAIVTDATAEEARGLWRNGQDVRIDGAGHCIHREQFGAVMRAVTTFIQGLA